MSDDTNKKSPAAPGTSRRRRRRRGSRRRSGGGEQGGGGQSGGGQSGGGQSGGGQSGGGQGGGGQGGGGQGGGGQGGAAPGSSERKRKRRRRPRRGGRGGSGGDGASSPASKERGDENQRSRNRRGGNRGGGNRSDGNRSDGNRSDGNRSDSNRSDSNRSDGNRSDGNRSDGNRGDGNRGDQQSRSNRSRDRQRAPLVAESRPEAIPESNSWEDTSSGPAPEMTPESLARWETPLFEPDADGEDVLPSVVADEADQGGKPARGEVTNMAPVRVKISTRLQDYDAGEFSLERGDQVVVQGDRGQAIGRVVAPSVRMLVTDRSTRRVLRRSTEQDLVQLERNEEKGKQALPYARERVMDRRLPMKLTRVEYLHGGSKAVFYFSAEGRVDFRDLVKDLAQRLRTRIEMRQIGVRDEAKMVGGIGVCGLRLCCHRYLTKFEPVSIRMAKDQNLVLNPQKVSGQCGRLKCCLAYEQEIYREQRKGMPKLGKFVETPDGVGKVVELDILARKVRVGLGMGKSEVYDADDVQPAPPPQRR